MKITTKYSIGQDVKIIPLERPGTIQAIYIGPQRLEYSIRYFDNAKPETIYFQEHEIEPKP